MRFIKKEIIHSKKYDSYQKTTKAKYNSSNNIFYLDVIIELLNCQQGLCAYTEIRLIEDSEIKSLITNYKDGKYVGDKKAEELETFCDLEHFDSNLKEDGAWSWDNFFVVFSPVNTKVKRIKEPEKNKNYIDDTKWKNILKPDRTGYEPENYFSYDKGNHVFYPNKNLSDDDAKKVNDMLIVLGINYGFIKKERKTYLGELLIKYQSDNSLEPEKFPTAFEMCKKQLENQG